MKIKIFHARAISDENPVYYDDWGNRFEKYDTEPFTNDVNHIILERNDTRVNFEIPGDMRATIPDISTKDGASEYIAQLCDKEWVPIQNILTQKYEYWNNNESIVTDNNNRIISYRKHDLFGGGEIIDGQCKIGWDKETNKMYFTYTFRKNKFGKQKARVYNRDPPIPTEMVGINGYGFPMEGILGSCTGYWVAYNKKNKKRPAYPIVDFKFIESNPLADTPTPGDITSDLIVDITQYVNSFRAIRIGVFNKNTPLSFTLNGDVKTYEILDMLGGGVENNGYIYNKETDSVSLFNMYPESIWNVSAVVGHISTDAPYVTVQAGLKTINQLKALFAQKTRQTPSLVEEFKKYSQWGRDPGKVNNNGHDTLKYNAIKEMLGDEFFHPDHLVRQILQNARHLNIDEFKQYMLKLNDPKTFEQYIKKQDDEKLHEQYPSGKSYKDAVEKVITAFKNLRPAISDGYSYKKLLLFIDTPTNP